jgi:hypothetical protein
MDGLDIVTVTPGMTLADVSVTLPLIAPLVAPTDCANAAPAVSAMIPNAKTKVCSRPIELPPLTG